MTSARKVAEEIAEKLVSDYIKSAPHGTLAQHREHIAAALLAAERRGMLRAAGIAEERRASEELSRDRAIAAGRNRVAECRQAGYELANEIAAAIERLQAERDRSERALAAARAEGERMRRVAIHTVASLVAAVLLLERGGKNAAPSDKMFTQMLADYKKAIEDARAALSAPAGEVERMREAIQKIGRDHRLCIHDYTDTICDGCDCGAALSGDTIQRDGEDRKTIAEAIPLTIAEMRASGSWDTATLDRLMDILGLAPSAPVDEATQKRCYYVFNGCAHPEHCKDGCAALTPAPGKGEK